jgi:membrane protease YdiL (CAAX protease family)
MALVLAVAAPGTPPPLGFLLGAFALLVLGMAWLSRTRPADLTLRSPLALRRASSYALVFAVTSAFFARIVNPALTGAMHSPWLLALGDVIFAAMVLFAWLIVLVEDLPLRDLGLRWVGGRRALWAWVLCILTGVLASLPHYLALWSGRIPFNVDAAAFGALYALGGAALPQELIFRGYLQGALEGRMNLLPRVVTQAVLFAALHLGRIIPGVDAPWSVFFAQVFGLLLPAGIFWGAMRELAGGSIWPTLVSHFLLRFGEVWANASPPAVP